MIEFTEARFNESGNIDVNINHPDFGWIPFTACSDDCEEHGRQIYADLAPTAAVYEAPL